MMSSIPALDLNRRRVAAISFLANISTEDEGVTEIHLDCLQNTHVLRDFQKNKKIRQNALLNQQNNQNADQGKDQNGVNGKKNNDIVDAAIGTLGAPKLSNTSLGPTNKEASLFTLHEEDSFGDEKEEEEKEREPKSLPPKVVESFVSGMTSRPSFDRLPRKLTFGANQNTIFREEIDDDHLMATASPLPGSPQGSAGFPGFKSVVNPDENLLHLDLSKADGGFLGPKSAPPGTSASAQAAATTMAATQGAREKETIAQKNSFNFSQSERPILGSNEHLLSAESRLPLKKKMSRAANEEHRASNLESSNESLGNPQRGRLRTLSGGQYSEAASSSSLREVRHVRGGGSAANSSEEDKKVVDDRLVFVSNEKKVPFAVFSVIPFQKSSGRVGHHRGDNRDAAKRTRTNSGNRPHSAINDRDLYDPLEMIGAAERTEDPQEISYTHLLHPTATLAELQSKMGRSHEEEQQQIQSGGMATTKEYSPHNLDGWLIAGRHRTFLPFPSYFTSVIEYVKPSEMKRELNSKFKERFPNLHLSLSKLRSLKREMRRIVVTECHLDLLTVALSYVFFEMLVLKNTINKMNRKFCAGACIILAAKLNDVKGAALANLIEKIESMFRLNRKDLLTSEFAVLVALEFSLHVPTWQVYPHYQRLLYET